MQRPADESAANTGILVTLNTETIDSDIKAAQAELDAKTAILQQEQSKLDEIDLNLTKCDIYAPAEGQVLYHNVYSSRSGRAEQVIEAGSRIRYRQIVIDLPNPQLMQVKAKNSMIAIVKPVTR